MAPNAPGVDRNIRQWIPHSRENGVDRNIRRGPFPSRNENQMQLPAKRVRRSWPMRSPLAEPLLVKNIVIVSLTLEQFWYEKNEMSPAAIAVTTARAKATMAATTA